MMAEQPLLKTRHKNMYLKCLIQLTFPAAAELQF